MGYQREQLLPIDFDHIFPDPLHLFLRISDVLINKFVSEILENLASTCEHRSNCKCPQGASLTAVTREAKKVGVSLYFWYKEEKEKPGAGKIKWTSLMGHERYKLMKALNFYALLPDNRAGKYRKLWDEFLALVDFINADALYTPQETTKFQRRAKNWVALLTEKSKGNPKSDTYELGMCDEKSITPYVHCLTQHMKEFLDLSKTIGIPLRHFSSEPVEKKNHIHTQLFYSKTRMDGMNGKSSVEEILEVENREIYFNHLHESLQHPSQKKCHIFCS